MNESGEETKGQKVDESPAKPSPLLLDSGGSQNSNSHDFVIDAKTIHKIDTPETSLPSA